MISTNKKWYHNVRRLFRGFVESHLIRHVDVRIRIEYHLTTMASHVFDISHTDTLKQLDMKFITRLMGNIIVIVSFILLFFIHLEFILIIQQTTNSYN